MLLRAKPEQIPRQIWRSVDTTALLGRPINGSSFKLLKELEGQLVFRGQSFLTSDNFHGSGIATDDMLDVKLVGSIAVIGPAFTNGGFRETVSKRRTLMGGQITLAAELTVDEDLAFGNVAGRTGDEMDHVYLLLVTG